jgi:hypothetical protein
MDSTIWKNLRILSAGVWFLFTIGMIFIGSKLWVVVGVLTLVIDQIIGHMYAKHLEDMEEIAAMEEMGYWDDQYDEDEDAGFDRDMI